MEEHSVSLGADLIVDRRTEDRAWALKLNFKAGWFLALVVFLLSAWILRSFFEPLLWASVIAIATWPTYRRFAHQLPQRVHPNATPLAFTILVALFILGPMVFAFGALMAQAQRVIDQIAVADKTGLAAPAWLQNVPVVGDKLAERWHAQLEMPGGVSVSLQRADTSAVFGWVQTLGQFMAHHLFIVGFAVLLLFFLYRGGDSLAMRIDAFLSDRLGDGAKPYIELGIVALRATVNGMAIVALFDGVLTGITYAVAGVQNAVVWAAVTGLFAMIPFVGYVVVAAVALVLVAKGAVVPGLAVGGLGVVILFAGDKVVRPMLVGNATKLGFAWVLMGSLGGLEAIGLLGLFVGPVVLALAAALWDEWTKRARNGPVAQC